MNTIRFITAAALSTVFTFAAAPSFAHEGETATEFASFVSTLSSAQVRQDAVAAAAQGLIVRGETSIPVQRFVSVLSRAQVVAETREALRLGLVDHGEQLAQLSPAQLDQVRMAGAKAVMIQVSSR